MNKNNSPIGMPWLTDFDNTSRDDFAITHKKLPEGFDSGIHWHDYVEVEIVTSGTGTNMFNGVEYQLTAGDVYVSSHFDCHRVINDNKLELIDINVSFSFLDKEMIDYLSTTGGILCHLTQKKYELIQQMAQSLFDDMDKSTPFSKFSAKTTINNIIINIIKNSNITVNPVPQHIQVITSYVNRNFNTDLTLEALAGTFNMSANYLGKLFKKHLNMSYNDYLNTVRIKYACHMISSSRIGIKEIAFSSGYSSTEYFHTVFKKHTGFTPMQYRAQQHKLQSMR